MQAHFDDRRHSSIAERIASLLRSGSRIAGPLAAMPWVLLTASLSAASVQTPVSAAQPVAAPSAETIWELTQMRVEVEQFGAELLTRAARYRGGLAEGDRNKLHQAVTEFATPQRLQKTAFDAFRALFDPVAAREVESWYESALGKQILAIEIAAGQGDATAQISVFVSDVLPLMNVDPERTEALRRVATATRAAENAVAMHAEIGRILTLAARAARPEKERRKLESIEAQGAAQAEVALHIVKQDLPVILLYIYVEIGDEDLAAYADFCESPGATWLFSALRHAMDTLANQLQREIVGRLEADAAHAGQPDRPAGPSVTP